VQRLRLVVIAAATFIGLHLSVLSDADTAIVDGAVSANDVAGSTGKASNS
jgi:hypothetical protein